MELESSGGANGAGPPAAPPGRAPLAGGDDAWVPDYYRIVLEHPHLSTFPRELHLAGTVPVGLLRIRQSSYETREPASDDFMLGVCFGEVRGWLELDFGEGRVSFDMPAGGAYLNSPAETHERMVGTANLMMVSSPHAALGAALGTTADVLRHDLRSLYERIVNDPLQLSLARAMWAAATTDDRESSLFVDQAMVTLALQTLRLARGDAPDATTFVDGERESVLERLAAPSSPLDDARLRRALEYIEAHLGEPLRLDALARVAGMGQNRFARAFRAATGEAPWAWVRRRRLERVCTLLSTTDDPIADIALACGFSSQAHLTQAFSQRYDATPGRYRRTAAGRLPSSARAG